jgi:hypothetical protein
MTSWNIWLPMLRRWPLAPDFLVKNTNYPIPSTMIKQVSSFQTSDGQLFEQEQQATAHQARLDFMDWYERNQIYGRFEGCKIEFAELDYWLKENAHKPVFRAYFETI